MFCLAIAHAHQELGAERIILGVFCNNLSALECHMSVGFRTMGKDSYMIDRGEWKGFEMELKWS